MSLRDVPILLTFAAPCGQLLYVRLNEEQARAIREAILSRDPTAEIILYGSRVDDTRRGGDIDLLVISDQIDFRGLLRLRREILDRIGWQQLDLVVRRRDQLDDPLARTALSEGIRL